MLYRPSQNWVGQILLYFISGRSGTRLMKYENIQLPKLSKEEWNEEIRFWRKYDFSKPYPHGLKMK